MATQTTNYGLKKPAYSDTADIGVINSNMDIIDAKMKEIDDKAGSGGGGTSVTIDSELSATSENPVQNKVITQALNGKGTYSKPTGGIPKTDLANEVQTSLGKADTALQEHQDISGKADKTEVTALYNSISDAWDSATAYTVGQYCIYNNALWKCLVTNTNTEPAEGTYWTKVSVANEIASVNSSLSDVNTNLSTIPKHLNIQSGSTFEEQIKNTLSGRFGWFILFGAANYQHMFGLVVVGDNYISGFLIGSWIWEGQGFITPYGLSGTKEEPIITQYQEFTK